MSDQDEFKKFNTPEEQRLLDSFFPGDEDVVSVVGVIKVPPHNKFLPYVMMVFPAGQGFSGWPEKLECKNMQMLQHDGTLEAISFYQPGQVDRPLLVVPYHPSQRAFTDGLPISGMYGFEIWTDKKRYRALINYDTKEVRAVDEREISAEEYLQAKNLELVEPAPPQFRPS